VEILGLIFCARLLAGIFTSVLRVVCPGLLSAFGAVAALTGPYSGWIVTWFHVPHTSHKGVART